MPKFSFFVAAASLTALSSCIPPEAPPPRHRPPPAYGPDNYDPNYGLTEPPTPEPPPAPVPEPTATGGYPTARKTDKPEEVISPYPPYNVIDVAGFTSGQLVRDPSNKKIFRVP